jgi:hypothetical protein
MAMTIVASKPAKAFEIRAPLEIRLDIKEIVTRLGKNKSIPAGQSIPYGLVQTVGAKVYTMHVAPSQNWQNVHDPSHLTLVAPLTFVLTGNFANCGHLGSKNLLFLKECHSFYWFSSSAGKFQNQGHPIGKTTLMPAISPLFLH